MRFVKRKWGYYFTLLSYKHFKVKLLWFRRGGECSRQYHQKRSELWLFLKGTGWLNSGMITKGFYYSIPVGETHKYKAIFPTLILEIQYGELCDEGDIVRIC